VSTGVVKFWNPGGWGIITPHGVRLGDRDREVFVHESKLPDGVSHLPEGVEVEFEVFPNLDKKPKAISVRLLSKQAYVPITQGQRKQVAHGD
jgi:cold shock CspA family protein